MKQLSPFSVLCLLLLAAASFAPALAQDVPATAQTTVLPRYVLTLPPGFVQVEGIRGKALCEPADREWVQKALSAADATTRPSTMPSDLLTRLEAAKAKVVAHMAADYAVDDPAPLAKRLDESLTPALRKLQEFVPPLFFLVTTEPRLKEMLKAEQWVSRDFVYNRLADEIAYRKSISLTLDRPMDDTVTAAFYEPADDQAARAAKLARGLDLAHHEVDQVISGRAMFLAHAHMIDTIAQVVFRPLDLPRDQQWLGIGLTGATSGDYAEMVIGSPRIELLLMLCAELRTNPIKTSTINLLDPTDPAAIKRQYATVYADAYRRKCVSVTLRLLDKNRPALPDLMRSLRNTPCKSGQELLDRVKQITGVDLSDAVK